MISALDGSATASAGLSVATGGGSATGADFDTFLKMLTAQLQNQDPLNPMEGTEFAVQLATFSGVEQQAQTNKLLNRMIAQLGGTQLGQFADWIGKEARTTQPVWFGDRPVTLDVKPDPAADSVTLITLSETGQEVSREEIGPGIGQIDWYGRDAAGDKLPDGRYSFAIESLRNGDVIRQDTVGAYARIVEAEVGDAGVQLIFQGGSAASVADVDALRDPT